MADALGISSKAAFKKDPGENGGGTPAYPKVPGGTDLAAGSQVPFTSESLTKTIERSVDPALMGGHAAPPSPIVLKDCSGSIGGRLRYVGWQRPFFCTCGFENPGASPAFLSTTQGTKTVSDASNTTPIVITTSTTHGYETGNGVRVASVGGNTAANGDWVITVLTTTTFELDDSAGSGTYTSGGTTQKFESFAHLFELDDALQDQAYMAGERDNFHANDRKVRRGQFGLKKQVEDWVFGSCIFNKFTIAGNPSEITTEFELIPYELYRGSYNSANWTAPTGSTAQALFQQTVIKVAKRSAMPTMQTIASSGFEIVRDNSMKADDRTTSSSPNIIIPVRDNLGDVTLKIERPRFSSGTGAGDDSPLLDDFEANEEYSISIEITGPVISPTTDTYQWNFYFPSVRYTGPVGPANIEGPGPMKQEWNFRAYRPITTDPFAASKYHSITVLKDSPLVIVTQNGEGTNYLTEA